MCRAEQSRAEQSRAEQSRAEGIDLYRILCCYLITTIHLLGYSKFLSISNISLSNFAVAAFISSINVIGTSGFVFISGYFLSEKGSSIDLRRVISFILELNFISIIIFVLAALFGCSFSISDVLFSFFPLLTQHYWYPFNYVILLLLYPFLNAIVDRFSKRELAGMIVILTGFICIFVKLNPFYSSAVFVGHSSHGFLWWILLYLTAAYYRRYGAKYGALCGTILLVGSVVISFIVIVFKNRISALNLFELEDNSILGYLATVSSFVLFSRIKRFHCKRVSRIVQCIVPSTFVAYLLQEHVMVRNVLWETVNIVQYSEKSGFYLLIVSVTVYLVLLVASVAIHELYMIAKKIYINRICSKVSGFLDSAIKRIMDYRS